VFPVSGLVRAPTHAAGEPQKGWLRLVRRGVYTVASV
jgi:hypothetical protein